MADAAVLSVDQFEVVAERLVAMSLRAMRPISLVVIPVDDPGGEAERLAAIARTSDSVADLGEGLVAVLCPLTPARGAVVVAERCLDELRDAGHPAHGAAVVSLPQSVMSAADLIAAGKTIALIDLRDHPAGVVVCADPPEADDVELDEVALAEGIDDDAES